MEDADIVDARDINKDPIKIGDTVRYVNRNTLGKVLDIKKDEEGIWVLLDSTELYYRSDALEVVDMELAKKEEEKVSTVEEIEKYVEKEEEAETVDLVNVTGGG